MTPAQLVQLASQEESKITEALFLNDEIPRKSVVFTAPNRRSGCSWIVARVARNLAQRVRGSVCVLDANLRWPAQHELFWLENTRGFLQALACRERISGYAQRISNTNLCVVPSGGCVEDSQTPFLAENFNSMFAVLKAEFDFLLVDCAAMKPSADAGVLGPLTDGAVLVIAANSTTRDTAISTRITLEAADVSIAGAILNKRTYPIPARIYQYL